MWFALITASSYTANLATILTTEQAHNAVSSLEQAGGLGWRICVYHLIKSEVSMKFPGINFVPVKYSAEPREFLRGSCEGILLHNRVTREMLAGALNERDCKELDSGK